MIIIPDVDMILQFEIKGRANSLHRAINAMYGGRTRDPSYNAWRKKVREVAGRTAHDADYKMPPKGTRLYLLTQFFMCPRKRVVFKKGRREGTVGYTGVRIPDSGNLNKGAEDACEGILYHNDNIVTTVMWPGYPTYITKVKNPEDQYAQIGLAFVDEPEETLL